MELLTWIISFVAIAAAVGSFFFVRLTSRRIKAAIAAYAEADKNYAEAEKNYAKTAEYYARVAKANEITAKINRGEPLTDEENAFLDEPSSIIECETETEAIQRHVTTSTGCQCKDCQAYRNEE